MTPGKRDRRCTSNNEIREPISHSYGPTCAEAQFACGQVDAALADPQGAVALARRFGAASSLGRALHVHGRLARDDPQLPEAIGQLRDIPTRLEHAHALIDVGAAPAASPNTHVASSRPGSSAPSPGGSCAGHVRTSSFGTAGPEVLVGAAFLRGAVPAPPNRTIGRRRDVAAVGERLRSRSVRLLTLTGPGASGRPASRSRWRAPSRPTSATARGSCRSRPFNERATSRRRSSPRSGSSSWRARAIERFLGKKELLLVLDNCEHVSAAASFIGGLPAASPGVTVLATSRAPLRVQAEQCHPVAPLALPGPGSPANSEALIDVEAVDLFCERARAHDPGFRLSDGNAADVTEICRRVDGLPLAIELAAARCGLLTPAEIAERLHSALRSPGAGARDAPPRQQTLQATIDWSHDLLTDDEKACFARFAVFAGGATIEAADTVTGTTIDVLDGLVAQSLLVRREVHGRCRLGMLETVRTYAAERLAGTADAVSIPERHYRYFLALAQRHASQRTLWGASRLEHLGRLDPELDNVLAALKWAAGRDAAGPLLELCAAYGEHWLMRGRFAAAVEWSEKALRKPGAERYPALRVRLLRNLAWALWPVGRVAEQPAVMAEARAIAEGLGDMQLLSGVLDDRAAQESFAGRFDVAAALADEALACARAPGDAMAIAMAAFARALAEQRPAELRERVDQAAALLAQTGNALHVAALYYVAGHRALICRADREALEFCTRATPLVRELESRYESLLLQGNFGMAALLTGDIETSRQAFRKQLQLCCELAVLPAAAQGLRGLAAVAAARDDLDRAARLLGAAAAHRHGQREHAADARLAGTFLEPARARLGAKAWDAAAREGTALSFEDAIAFALEDAGTARAAAGSVH